MDQNSLHAAEETLELYSMERLQGSELEQFEDHLFLCSLCQDHLTEFEAYEKAMRAAAATLRTQAAPFRAGLSWIGHPWRPAWALAFAVPALLLCAAIWQRRLHRHPATPALVMLASSRGSENPASAVARAEQPLVLSLDLTDLPRSSQCRVEIVDLGGRTVSDSRAAPSENQARIALSRGLPAGLYYVRLYAPDQELLREYALSVQD